MGLSIKNIKKWWKMINGKSIGHVQQNIGKIYSFKEIKGYYNDLTNKVLKDNENYNKLEVIKYKENKEYFPIAVFQYGLACYDLFLLKGDDYQLMEQKFLIHLDWCYKQQLDDGSWKNFIEDYPNTPFSSMAQGEGASLLIRGYIHTKDKKYLLAAKKAIDFMLQPINEDKNGGTAVEDENNLYLYEFTCFPYVYNGWLFSIFGLIDYVILTNDKTIKEKLNKTINTFLKILPNMDNGYWSMYRNDKTIASPFYHRLHIAQLKIMYEYTNNELFLKYAQLFEKYESKKINKIRAFIKKAFQKVFR